ncbi:MAG: energy transducer TonB [Oligoflexia bacterium]
MIHVALVFILGPGHEEENHTVRWFDGTVELGEPGDGHHGSLHFHRENQKVKKRTPRSEPDHTGSSQDLKTANAGTSTPEPAPGDTGLIELNEEFSQSLASGGRGGAPLDEKSRYILTVLQRLDAVKKYPRESLLREEEGKVTLTLVIATDGTIQSYEITRPSHFLALNRATLEAAARIGKLAPLPSLWARSIRLPVTLSYKTEQ